MKEKRKRHIWISILNVLFVLIVVSAMLLMVVSELVLDTGLNAFGYCLESGTEQSVLIVHNGLEVMQVPYLAGIASYVNSVPGYVTVIFPPCVLLVILQVIASSLEKKQESKQESKQNAELKKQEQKAPQTNEQMNRPVITQSRGDIQTADAKQGEDAQVQELKQNIEQLKAALQQSQTQNEELRIRAVQAIKKAREQSPQPMIYQPQMPPQVPQYPVYPVYPMYPLQQYYPTQGYYPPQQYYPYPPQQGPMQ